MKAFKKCVGRLVSIIFLAMLAVGIYVFITVLTTDDGKVPNVFGYSFLKVTTGSMEPELKTGSIIIVESVPPETVKVGDIICFYSRDPNIEGVPNTHRVLEIKNGKDGIVFTTKGDANDLEDQYPVYGSDLVGAYQKSITELQKFYDIAQSQYFFFFALLIPLCLVVFFEFNNLKKVISDSRKSKPSETEQSDESVSPKGDENGADNTGEDTAHSDAAERGEYGTNEGKSDSDK